MSPAQDRVDAFKSGFQRFMIGRRVWKTQRCASDRAGIAARWRRSSGQFRDGNRPSEASDFVTPFTPLRSDFRESSKTRWFHMVRMDAVDAYVLYLRNTPRFPSWTSRVRSPSPAFRINSLAPSIFHIVSVYSVKKAAHPNCPLLVQSGC